MIAATEQKLQQLIKSTIGPQLKQVAMLPAIESNIVLNKLMTSAPAVYTHFNQLAVRNNKAELRFSVFCFARNARGHVGALTGDDNTIGLYQMIEQIVNAAHLQPGWRIDEAVKRPSDKSFLDSGLYAALIPVTYPVSLPLDIDISGLDDFALFHSEIDIDASQSDEPAAIDDVTVPIL